MEKREDRRTAMSKRMMKDALTEILKEKDIYHVSIRELCERADVNRTTFYKYYGSQFDLLADMEKDLLVFLADVIRELESDTIKAIETACSYLENHLEFARLIFNNNVDSAFPQKVFSMEAVKEAVRDILPPPRQIVLRWGLLAQQLLRAEYQRAIPVCPTVPIWVISVICYEAFSLIASFMMLIAAFTSLSIMLPHSHR